MAVVLKNQLITARGWLSWGSKFDSIIKDEYVPIRVKNGYGSIEAGLAKLYVSGEEIRADIAFYEKDVEQIAGQPFTNLYISPFMDVHGAEGNVYIMYILLKNGHYYSGQESLGSEAFEIMANPKA